MPNRKRINEDYPTSFSSNEKHGVEKFRDFAHPSQVENLKIAEAGLLTCFVRAAFPPLFGSDHSIARTFRNLQQRGLSRIYTRFPFHRNAHNGSIRTFAAANIGNISLRYTKRGRKFQNFSPLFLFLFLYCFAHRLDMRSNLFVDDCIEFVYILRVFARHFAHRLDAHNSPHQLSV